jgi:hypothetical protein
MLRWLILALLAFPQSSLADSFSRQSLEHRLPSIINWKERKGLAPVWGDVFFRYSPHFVLMSGDDADTIASIGSKLSHKVAAGFKKNWGDNNRAGIGYAADFESYYRNQGVATLNNGRLFLNQIFIFNEYLCLERFSIITQLSYSERPYYNRVASNSYDLEKDGHLAPSLGTQFLMFQSGHYAFAADAAYTYYFEGHRDWLGNKNISGIRFATEISRTSFEYEYDRHRIAVDVYFNYEFAQDRGAERTTKDLGVTLKYDFSITGTGN